MKIAGKVVVITGAANGLGKALAYAFSRRQANIIAIDIDKTGLRELQNQLPDVITIAADVTDHDQLKRAFDQTIKIAGQIDIWINNAGIIGPDRPALEQKMTDVKSVYGLNVFALIEASILVGRYFEEQRTGWLINMISGNALGRWPHRSIYSSSKYAARGFTLALQHELAHTKVLGVYPDGTKTGIFGDEVPAEFDKFLEPEAVASRVVQAVERDQTKDLVIRR